MKRTARAAAGALGMLWLLGAGAAACAASNGPDMRTMIEALTPSTTRGMRNLLVRQNPAAAGEAGAGAASAAMVASAPQAGADTSPPAEPGPPPSLSLAIQFEANSARVRPQSGAVLGSLVAAMQSPELKASRFLIEGHADARGTAAQNQRLSQERADEVRLYLVALGVNPARLRAVGNAATQAAHSGDPGSAQNRRVRVVTVE